MSTLPGFRPLGAPSAPPAEPQAPQPASIPVPAPAPPAPQAAPAWQPAIDEHSRRDLVLAQVDPDAVEKLWDRLTPEQIAGLSYRSPEVDQLVEALRLQREKWFADEAQRATRKRGGGGARQRGELLLTGEQVDQMPF